jgi:hypothetical protein
MLGEEQKCKCQRKNNGKGFEQVVLGKLIDYRSLRHARDVHRLVLVSAVCFKVLVQKHYCRCRELECNK